MKESKDITYRCEEACLDSVRSLYTEYTGWKTLMRPHRMLVWLQVDTNVYRLTRVQP